VSQRFGAVLKEVVGEIWSRKCEVFSLRREREKNSVLCSIFSVMTSEYFFLSTCVFIWWELVRLVTSTVQV
jgi:hypothetical protein